MGFFRCIVKETKHVEVRLEVKWRRFCFDWLLLYRKYGHTVFVFFFLMFCVTVRFRYVRSFRSFAQALREGKDARERTNEQTGGRKGETSTYTRGHKGGSEGGKGKRGGVTSSCQFVVKTGSPEHFICTFNTI